eukprot:UN11624
MKLERMKMKEHEAEKKEHELKELRYLLNQSDVKYKALVEHAKKQTSEIVKLKSDNKELRRKHAVELHNLQNR